MVKNVRPQLGKDKILNAALRLFAQKGYHKTSINDIARSADVAKGLLYNYYKSKDALLLEIISDASLKMMDMADGMFKQKTYAANLEYFINSFFNNLTKNKQYFTFQIGLMFQPDLKVLVAPLLQQRADNLLSATKTMFESSSVKSPELTARRFTSEVDGITLHYLSVYENYPILAVKEELYKNYKDL